MKKMRIPLLLLICFILYLLGTRIYLSRNVLSGNYIYFKAEELFSDGKEPLGELISDVEQTIKIERSTSALDLLFATYARENSGILKINISDLETGTIYYDDDIDIHAMQDNTYIRLSFYNTITLNDNENKYLSVKIAAPESNDGNAVTIWGSINDKYADGSLSINGEEIQSDIAFALIEQNKVLTILMVAVISIICIMIAFVAYYLLFCKHSPPDKLILFLGISLGLFSLLINPPGSIPDEIAHIHTSYLWSNSIMGLDSHKSNNATSSNDVYTIWDSYRRSGDFEKKDVKNLFSSTPSLRTYVDIIENWNWISLNEDARSTESRFFRVNGSLAQYLITATGITVARVLSVGFFPLLYLGGLFNLAFFVFAVHWAIKRTPIGKNAMMIIAILPMVVHLSPSYSYDSPILALSFMFIAQIMWLTYGDYGYVKNGDIIITAIIVIFLFPCKVIAYLPLMFLMLLIPKSKFRNKRSKMLFFLGITIVSLISILFNNWSTARNFLYAKEGAWNNRLGDTGYTFGWIFENPLRFLTIFWNTAREFIGYYLNTMIGSKLNWLNTPVSDVAIFTMILCLFAISIREESDKYIITNKQKIIVIFSCMLCCLFIGTGMLLWETSFGDSKIAGIQGRYFLPILPALMYVIRPRHIVSGNGIWRKITMLAVCSELMVLMDNFVTIIAR